MTDRAIAADLARLSADVVGQARARQAALGLAEAELDFAVLLADKRAEWAGRHLTAEAADRPYVARWLELVAELSAARLAEAQTTEEVEDAALSALDSVHSYLLAHELVGPGYLAEEQALCDQLFPEFSERARLLEQSVRERSAQHEHRALPESGQEIDRGLAPPLG